MPVEPRGRRRTRKQVQGHTPVTRKQKSPHRAARKATATGQSKRQRAKQAAPAQKGAADLCLGLSDGKPQTHPQDMEVHMAQTRPCVV